jgi:hypothetical protein
MARAAAAADPWTSRPPAPATGRAAAAAETISPGRRATIDPVSKALVYVPSQLNAYPKGVGCDLCNKPVDVAAVQTVANADGTYSLSLDGLPYSQMVQFVVAKGRFRRVTNLPVQCGMNAAPKTASTLPGKSADGDIPKIAVGTGNSDHLDQVLVALGITEFTCLEGRKSNTTPATCMTTGKLSDLLTGAGGLHIDDYNMVFIACAPGAWANYQAINVSTATIVKTLQDWTAKGGRAFVTDNSYDYVAQAFGAQLGWQGPAAMPWPVDGANVGVATINNMPVMLSAMVDDMDLAAWLKVVGVMSSPMVTISGLLSKWSVLAGPVPKGTVQITDGTAPFTVNNMTMMADVPLTTEFLVNTCGKVIYSSYHTLSTVKQNSLSAQERILEYLMLDAAACTHMISNM